ncbi:MAG: potassium transporter [Ferrovum sp. 37-45-19]|jgi:CPA2 family monovalent cation:H+ antiporter-2|uniref:cation:proton antiporter domain-containing protein n=1 Tax=Ferrovum sp. JA12 TaxID=1356299 RepID=UPI00070265E0|nr:cation:proton antiporter [Ferrovum sp. JA12]OYV79611.1 MAG: potassium transporter [Ferrovum sp. 21-44-67]OYV94594.1 MAG: potassium transporter [Ferrovum sp. 37-45-19]HQT81536.1 cation:proton antiporter [Ferrovaceae bacterium]KRH79508.1 glutathione-regulated potassium-efflux system protein KefC [Ferrovum sp. JA12]HQU06424.1 cation:proton antiporter [Ferrovaceae bacterium]
MDALNLTLILLISAILAVSLCKRLGLPPVFGYLLAGIIIGPNATGLVPQEETTVQLANFGIVFLMFTVGLEFSLGQLAAMKKTVFGLGSVQLASSFLVFFALGYFLALSWQANLILSGALSLSSTAIMARLLTERLEMKSIHGQRIMGILLFQDLAVVPFLILISSLSVPHNYLLKILGFALIKALLILILLLGIGKKILDKLFFWVAKQKSSEVFLLNILLVTLGMSFITEKAGLSLALGAFMSGILISETDYRYQVEDYIKPFRDVLLGLFFITIGALLNLHIVIDNVLWVMAGVMIILIVKLVVAYVSSRIWRNIDSVSLRIALAISPAGEFGFVLLAQSVSFDFIGHQILQIVLASMLVSMMVSPLLIQMSDRIVLYCCESEWSMRAVALHQLAAKTYSTKDHIIVCGYGRSGQNLTRFLEQESLMVIALDKDTQRVRAAAVAGESVVYGDASRREVLIAAGIHRASAVIVTFADTATSLAIINHVRELEPGIPVIVRTYDDTDLDKLKHAGAAEVVPEILEGSLMLASHAMLELGIPLSKVLKRIRQVRAERYHLMRGFFRGVSDENVEVDEGCQPRLISVLIMDDAYAKGKKIKDLLEGCQGTEITTIRRHGVRNLFPEADTELMAQDIIVLLGSSERLAHAENYLLQGVK